MTPGLIDIHVHVYPGVSHYGVSPDATCLARGVTTVCDAGSAGADTFDGLRRYVIDVSETRVLAFLNIAAIGMVSPLDNELEDLRHASPERAIGVVERNRDLIQGIKVRLQVQVDTLCHKIPGFIEKATRAGVRRDDGRHLDADRVALARQRGEDDRGGAAARRRESADAPQLVEEHALLGRERPPQELVDDLHVRAARHQERHCVGVESRPLLTSGRAKASVFASSSTASRRRRLPLLLGVMKSVERVEFSRLSSAANARSS
mgnify:CR=1 FL=1